MAITLPDGLMPLTPYDEILVALLKLPTSVVEYCEGRVFHVENFKQEESEANIPCIVYSQTDDVPEQELSGRASVATAIYEVNVIAHDSQVLRDIASDLKDYNDEDMNDAIVLLWPNFLWITVDSDNEGSELSAEQQDKGFKTATFSITVLHNGDT